MAQENVQEKFDLQCIEAVGGWERVKRSEEAQGLLDLSTKDVNKKRRILGEEAIVE